MMSSPVVRPVTKTFTYPSDFAVSGTILKVARVREELEYLYDVDPAVCIQQLRDVVPKADIFTFWQRLPCDAPAYTQFHYEWDNLAAIPISSYDEWYRTQIHQNTRNKIRKAQKSGIVVKEFSLTSQRAAEMADIFNETPYRQGRHFSHFGKTAAQVQAEWSSESDISTFIGAFFQEQLVGFIKLLNAGNYYRTSGTIAKLAFRDKAPMNALIAQSVHICAERQMPYLVYGKFVYGAKGEDSLSEFKRHNGFHKYNLPRYFVPLTNRGRFALTTGLHRPLKEMLPGPIARTAVSIRSVISRRAASAK